MEYIYVTKEEHLYRASKITLGVYSLKKPEHDQTATVTSPVLLGVLPKLDSRCQEAIEYLAHRDSFISLLCPLQLYLEDSSRKITEKYILTTKNFTFNICIEKGVLSMEYPKLGYTVKYNAPTFWFSLEELINA